MMKLFAIYVGGEHPGANIEVHDIRFVAAETIEATYPTLLAQWWGKPGSLHVDCWSDISHADGYAVTLREEPFDGAEKLYYVNLGGYDGLSFAEQHRNVFVVADSLAAARSRAIRQAKDWTDAHRDDMYEAEQAFALDDAAETRRLHIHLTPSPLSGAPAFTCHYTPLR
jgi:hypothetical protein